jgi:hypothetical protein
MLEGLKNRARLLKIEVYAIYLSYKDPRVPWYARIFAVCVVGYGSWISSEQTAREGINLIHWKLHDSSL